MSGSSVSAFSCLRFCFLSCLFFAAQAVARTMIERGEGGRIINMSSLLGLKVLPQLSLYAISKAAIAQMSSNAQPVARGGQAIDIANAVAFLASEEAGFMTGASLIVDGGITLGPRHSWDPEEPRLFAALEAMEEQAKKAAQPAA